jgi:hypothetical protein
MEGVRSEAVQAEACLRIAILGKPKSGKSWLAATAPGPIRYYDFDNRSESLEGKPNLYILSRPTMLQVETDISIMKAAIAKAKQAGTKPALPATVVFDSVTYMNRAMEEEIFRQDPKLCRTIKVGNSTSVKLRNGWDTINGIQRYVEYLIAELTNLGVNFIFVFHEKDEKDRTESTAEKSAYTGLVTTDPQYLQNSLSLFNEVYRITVDGNKKYEVTCRPNWDVNASTTMLLDDKEYPDIMKIIAKHRAKRAALPKNALKKP